MHPESSEVGLRKQEYVTAGQAWSECKPEDKNPRHAVFRAQCRSHRVLRILISYPPKFPALKIYEVDLERDGNAVIFSCDCPYFEDHREVCKHVWATLLQLEKLGHLQEWNASFPEELIATDSDDDLDDDYIDDLDPEEVRTHR